jgi:glycosyltransferase involved in cell wall biosynthesis
MFDVSVCVAMFNAGKVIVRGVEALFAQTMRDGIEFIFVDDGSTDGSVDELRKQLERFPEVAGQVRIIELASNGGVGNARMRGFAECTGRYVICCDIDDRPDPEWCRTLYRKAVSENADMVYCDFTEVEVDGRRRVVSGGSANTAEGMIRELLSGKVMGSLWMRMYRREIVRLELRKAMPDGVRCCEDLLMNLIMLRRCRTISKVEAPLYDYIRNPASVTKTLNREARKSIYVVMRCVVEMFSEEVPFEYLQYPMRRALYAAISVDVPSGGEWRKMWCGAKRGMWRDSNFGIFQKALFYLACINLPLARFVYCCCRCSP